MEVYYNVCNKCRKCKKLKYYIFLKNYQVFLLFTGSVVMNKKNI